jgi:hypothetical protein
MGSIIEMAARNELLRRDGRYTAHEFLDKIEAHLTTRPSPTKETDSTDEEGEKKPDTKATWSMLAPHASGTESSAWIPAVRPKKEGKE